jgi:hypothetical protein
MECCKISTNLMHVQWPFNFKRYGADRIPLHPHWLHQFLAFPRNWEEGKRKEMRKPEGTEKRPKIR